MLAGGGEDRDPTPAVAGGDNVTPHLSARVVETTAGLHALEPAWWDLFARSPAATPFQSPAWLIPWWDAFAPGRLTTVAVEAGGRLVALAPLWFEDGPHGRRLLPVGIGITDYADVLLDPAFPAVADALMQALGSIPDWEILSLEDLHPAAVARRLPVPPGWSADISDQSVCPVLDLANGTTSVPADRRRKIRRACRLLETRGRTRIESVPAADVPAFLDVLFALHEARWRERGEPGIVADPRVQTFHRAALPRLAEAGLARLYTLNLDEQTVAAWYGLKGRGTTYAYLGGFDPAFAYESPGSVLMMHAIEVAVADGDRVFDFLRGEEDYKRGFGATNRRTGRLHLARKMG
ncbi:GNAT family N-acetyltransferase [Chthonobacter albigriseus]|uniref:GNAT family N-acetyltransferase n=1 Tax=Chthonobacter albigriseus TaxID=1683161 RepID=UPI0015EEF8E2|nr:GNAT family N-acetyltransferase [Chthonobacter albigriseus]